MDFSTGKLWCGNCGIKRIELVKKQISEGAVWMAKADHTVFFNTLIEEVGKN